MPSLFFILALPTITFGQARYSTPSLSLAIDRSGNVTSLFDVAGKKEYLAPRQPAPFLTIRTPAGIESPSALTRVGGDTLRLTYARSNAFVDVTVKVHPTHLTFEIVRTSPSGAIDAVIWGPYPTRISKTVGEIVGVVRDGRFAIGIQALNPKTIGSYPENAEGFEMSRGRAAEPRRWGSVLQCYSLDRSRPRQADVWLGSFPAMPIEPIPGETVAGSKIALFGCPEPDALDAIGAIEVAEGLPHPMLNGVWFKKSKEQGRSYLIADFDENMLDTLLSCTERAGLMTLYHMQPFASWGHYRVNTTVFPSGAASLRACVTKARARGIRLGAHTLTTFIQTNDPYVTPVPDPRLAKTGSSTLTASIDTAATDIPVASPTYFVNEKANWLHAAVIGKEIIRYRAVSDKAPWVLLDCRRGAFGTHVAPHASGAVIGKLLDHAYEVFFPNFELQREIARNLARTFNETGLEQMDFDGHEGCASSGQGDYAYTLFAQDFHENLDHAVINGTSNSKHYYWHVNSYCNWGEPWTEGFRESMQEYRIQNQGLFERNYLPNMLGWYLLTPATTLSDMEWMLARAAGFNAGFALATNMEAIRTNAELGPILDAIREWETARRAGVFTTAQRAFMKDPKNEFHLEAAGPGSWKLSAYHETAPFRHEKIVRQPGEPTFARWTFSTQDAKQPMQFKLRLAGDGASVTDPAFDVDRSARITFPVELQAGQTLVCEGTSIARVYDNKGRQVRTVNATGAVPAMAAGNHEVKFACEFKGTGSPIVTVTFKTRGEAVMVP
jgi:hypothetical protein